jgi:hypothetical protein
MPSQKPVIALRLEPALHARVAAAARQEGRSLSNFVAHHLARMVGPVPTRRPQGDPVDSLAGAIARQVQRGATRSHK